MPARLAAVCVPRLVAATSQKALLHCSTVSQRVSQQGLHHPEWFALALAGLRKRVQVDHHETIIPGGGAERLVCAVSDTVLSVALRSGLEYRQRCALRSMS